MHRILDIPAPRQAAARGNLIGAQSGVLPVSHSLEAAWPLFLSALLLLGFGLRLVLLDRFRFHQDEALYGFWALHFLRDDPLFLKQWIDKPPLFIWLLGSWFQLVDASEAGARLLNVTVSTLTIPVAAAVARQTWSAPAGLFAAAATALSPFAISYSPTAFTDPLLVLAGLCSVCAARKGRPLWAGLLLGAAIMTKQQGVFFAPLTLGFLALEKARTRTLPASALLFAGGLALAILPVLYWDSLRWTVAPSPWDLGIRNYAAIELLPVAEWPGRAARIAVLSWYLTASHLVWALLGVATVAAVFVGRALGSPLPARGKGAAALICAWMAAYWAVHAVGSLPLWDRYFLPVAAAFALITGWVGAAALSAAAGRWKWAAILFWILLLLPGGLQAAKGRLPIGSDHGAYNGLRESIAWLDEHSPQGTLLYHQVLSWHLQYYLYENPRQYTVLWFASPVALADNAAKRPGPGKFLLNPAWMPLRNRDPHLAARGLELIERFKADEFSVYELVRRRRRTQPDLGSDGP